MSEARQIPNAIMRLFLDAVEEVLGEKALNMVLKRAGKEDYIENKPPNDTELGPTLEDYGRIEEAIEQVYGGRGAKAVLMRIGRANFRRTLDERGRLIGVVGLTLDLIPSYEAKLKLFLKNLASAAVKHGNLPVRLEEAEDGFLYIYEDSPSRFRPRKEKPCCFVTVGFLSEAVRWATKQNVQVREVSCIACGDETCTFVIPRHP